MDNKYHTDTNSNGFNNFQNKIFSENLCKKTVPSSCCGGVDRLESTHTKQMDRISLALISSTLKAQKGHKIDT